MDTLHLGGIDLSRAIYEYQRMGYNVSIPLIDAQDYDLAIEKDGKFQAVQCRYTSQRKKLTDGRLSENRFTVSLRTIKTNTTETVVKKRGSYDILFVMCEGGNCYSIPAGMLPMSHVDIGGEKYECYKVE